MNIPARIIRARELERDPKAYALTERQQTRHERILAGAQSHVAEFGYGNITFRDMATGLRMGTATLRFHFADMHALLAEIIRRHLRALTAEIIQIPQNAPNCHEQRRVAYANYTRTTLGNLTEAHLILVRDRHLLPNDERESIERLRHEIGRILAGDLGPEALHLLDAPFFETTRIEQSLAPKQPTAALQAPPQTPFMPTTVLDPNEKPGDWVYACVNSPAARASPSPA